MAHYALLNSDNEVINIITGVDESVTQTDTDCTLIGGSREAWEAFYAAQPWHGATSCKLTSTDNFRKNHARIGYTYDTERDAFIAPQPYASWVFDESTCRWEAPVPRPVVINYWQWDESVLNWVEM